MTAQLPNKRISNKKHKDDASFMLRWLNGTLSEEEIHSLRNRKDYEEMMELGTKERHLSSEMNKASSFNQGMYATPSYKPLSFFTFAFVAVAVILMAILVFKFNW